MKASPSSPSGHLGQGKSRATQEQSTQPFTEKVMRFGDGFLDRCLEGFPLFLGWFSGVLGIVGGSAGVGLRFLSVA